MQFPPPTWPLQASGTPAWPSFAATDSTSSPDSRGSQTSARKPTYIVRKEEKEGLLKELEALQLKLRLLQQRESHPLSSTPLAASASASPPDLLQRELATSLLGDAVRFQQLSLVHVQSAVSSYVSAQESVPHEMTIHLTADLDQRRAVLMNIKPRKIRAALAYLGERTRFLDLTRPQAETAQGLLSNGDFCVQRLNVTVFEEVDSVRRVYDAARHYFHNMELSLTDVLGDITTRDDTTYDSIGVQQSRMVSNLSCGVELEVNEIMNFEFSEADETYGGGGPLGVITADFVDHDDLFPYNPRQRVRHDVTAVLAIRSVRRKRVHPISGEIVDEQVVVLTRSCFLKLHSTSIAMPPLLQHRLHQQLGRWGDVMITGIVERVYTAA